MGIFEVESGVYEAHLAEWLEQHKDQWVAIKGTHVLGFYQDRPHACEKAFSFYGNVPVLVRPVAQDRNPPQLPLVYAGVGGSSMHETYDVEIGVYDASLEVWLDEHEGRWVVINGTEVLGFYETDGDAYKAGFGRYGETPFLIRQVARECELVRVPLIAAQLRVSD